MTRSNVYFLQLVTIKEITTSFPEKKNSFLFIYLLHLYGFNRQRNFPRFKMFCKIIGFQKSRSNLTPIRINVDSNIFQTHLLQNFIFLLSRHTRTFSPFRMSSSISLKLQMRYIFGNCNGYERAAHFATFKKCKNKLK